MVIHLVHGAYYWVRLVDGSRHIGRWDGFCQRWFVCGFDGAFETKWIKVISKPLEYQEE